MADAGLGVEGLLLGEADSVFFLVGALGYLRVPYLHYHFRIQWGLFSPLHMSVNMKNVFLLANMDEKWAFYICKKYYFMTTLSMHYLSIGLTKPLHSEYFIDSQTNP